MKKRGNDATEEVDAEWVENDEAREEQPGVGRRIEKAVGPVVAGLIIDSLDFVTFGTPGMLLGAIVGGTVAYYICGVEDLPVWQRVLIATLAGFYCAVPSTNFIPAATVVGALVRFWSTERK